MGKLSIGELARQANVNIETIRYYERRGLLPEPPRNRSGHRQYPPEALRRTDFIKRCQALGFSLNEITEILELRITPESTCADMKLRVGEKLTDVDKKIQELVHIRDALSRLVKKCTGKGPIGSQGVFVLSYLMNNFSCLKKILDKYLQMRYISSQ